MAPSDSGLAHVAARAKPRPDSFNSIYAKKKRLGRRHHGSHHSIMAMGEIKYDDYTEEEQALMKGAPYVMKPLQGQDDAACHRSVGV